jgi:hypothetical protein
MRIEMTADGPVVPAAEIAPLLGVEPAELPRLMREGAVTARHEVGMDEDAGRFRLNFHYGDRLVRVTCSDDGTVLKWVRITGAEPERARG